MKFLTSIGLSAALLLSAAARADQERGAYRTCKLDLNGKQVTLEVFPSEFESYRASIGTVVRTVTSKDGTVESKNFDNAIITIGGWIDDVSATYIDDARRRIELNIDHYGESTYESTYRVKYDMDCRR